MIFGDWKNSHDRSKRVVRTLRDDEEVLRQYVPSQWANFWYFFCIIFVTLLVVSVTWLIRNIILMLAPLYDEVRYVLFEADEPFIDITEGPTKIGDVQRAFLDWPQLPQSPEMIVTIQSVFLVPMLLSTVIGLLLILRRYFETRDTTYVLTGERLLITTVRFLDQHRKRIQIRWAGGLDQDVEEPWYLRIRGLGNVEIISRDVRQPAVVLKGVPEPQELESFIGGIVRRESAANPEQQFGVYNPRTVGPHNGD